jgi:uncharacterized protein with ParB-like and HNH nuclease domain
MIDPKIEIKTLNLLFRDGDELTIPEYQRPYRWKKRNVIQLLEDISENIQQEKSIFRLGTLILHKEGENLNIVDGQQRLVTLSIILYILGEKDLLLLQEEFPHIDSKNNIKFNFQQITEWFLSKNSDFKTNFKNYILNKCEFVTIELNDVAEAFQLFDSQNARGKSLEPYDLLKAFHLREMYHNMEEERQICAKQWEKSVNNNTLKILGLYLYRIRLWARGEYARTFTKDDIDEFKGFNLFECAKYPYLKPLLMNNALIDNYRKDKVISNLIEIQYPFQITQLIINGKRFFEYVSFYSDLYTLLCKSDFYEQYCKYAGSSRAGDRYVREMYKALCLLFVDKFGKEEFTDNIRNTLYKWCYFLRIGKKRVFLNSIDKYIHQDNQQEPKNAFEKINREYYPHLVVKNMETPFNKFNKDDIPYNIEKVVEIFNK